MVFHVLTAGSLTIFGSVSMQCCRAGANHGIQHRDRGPGGPSGLSAQQFTWDSLASGSITAAVLFAIAFFVGFKSMAILGEEAGSPERTSSLGSAPGMLWLRPPQIRQDLS